LDLSSLQLYQWLPYAFACVVVLGAFFYFVRFYRDRVQPPTDEPEIGTYRFALMGTGRVLEGLTTTAVNTVNEAVFYRLRSLGSEKVDQIRDALNGLYLYAVREGKSKVLIISDQNIENEVFSDSIRGQRWSLFGGWSRYRCVYGFGVEVSSSEFPELFRFFGSDWDSSVFIYPENLKSRRKQQTDIVNQALDLTQLLLLLKRTSLSAERAQALEEVLEVKEEAIDQLHDLVAESVDRAHLAEQDALYSTPFSTGGRDEDVRRGRLPSLTWWLILTLVLAGACGYVYLPRYVELAPLNSAIVGASLCYGFWVFWHNWLRERIL
jgi:hypothetical protein